MKHMGNKILFSYFTKYKQYPRYCKGGRVVAEYKEMYSAQHRSLLTRSLLHLRIPTSLFEESIPIGAKRPIKKCPALDQDRANTANI